MKTFECQIKYHWHMYLGIQLAKIRRWFKQNNPLPDQHQPRFWCRTAFLGHDELMHSERLYNMTPREHCKHAPEFNEKKSKLKKASVIFGIFTNWTRLWKQEQLMLGIRNLILERIWKKCTSKWSYESRSISHFSCVTFMNHSTHLI